ncbi:CheR family methyltransferase [Georgenia subflava]|uniref:protein-glutamate O-methyltransferase n=1 Tax=Georgenia subflava TaxID=1622177 RepID=A0A6N7ELX7_9MICO|nr:protein-glutamate O-methyltransferase CheR [Georgenia subflava]MPV38073.1 methyltransferase domain-containing protein [Georgenia subflava]
MSMSSSSFSYVTSLLRRTCAVDLHRGKRYLVESRLARLAHARGHTGADAVDRYVGRLRAGADRNEAERVVEALMTTETSWFRDGSPFAALDLLLGALPARTGGPRLWSAGCSTGQEPYSLAMVLLDNDVPDFSVLATDLSAAVLRQACTGRYTEHELARGLPDGVLERHFRPAGERWQVSAAVRSRVTFRRHNLLDPGGPGGTFDIVFLRHVLMHLDLAARAAVLGRVRRHLVPGGLVVLGAGETPVGVDDSWRRLTLPGVSAYRLAESAA